MKHHLIPFPAFVIAHTGNFAVSNTTEISIEPSVELEGLGNYLVEHIGEATGIRNIIDTGLGKEGYELSISANATKLSANHLARLFFGIQTLRQLLPTHHTQNVSLHAVKD
jgi:hexosaminidase